MGVEPNVLWWYYGSFPPEKKGITMGIKYAIINETIHFLRICWQDLMGYKWYNWYNQQKYVLANRWDTDTASKKWLFSGAGGLQSQKGLPTIWLHFFTQITSEPLAEVCVIVSNL